ncbi:MAG: hypothetical protein WCW78_02200 [Candidatus Paceibacterota bacterium]|jgi:hypothetical protein
MRTFVLFLIFLALCGIAAILCFDVFVTVAEKHQVRANPPSVIRYMPDNRHTQCKHPRRITVETDSAATVQQAGEQRVHGGIDTSTLKKHDDLWDNW